MLKLVGENTNTKLVKPTKSLGDYLMIVIPKSFSEGTKLGLQKYELDIENTKDHTKNMTRK